MCQYSGLTRLRLRTGAQRYTSEPSGFRTDTFWQALLSGSRPGQAQRPSPKLAADGGTVALISREKIYPRKQTAGQELRACPEIRFLGSTGHWFAAIEFNASVAFLTPSGRPIYRWRTAKNQSSVGAASKLKMPPRRGFWLGGIGRLQIGRSYGAAASLVRSASVRPTRASHPCDPFSGHALRPNGIDFDDSGKP